MIVLINPPHPYLIQPNSQAPLGLLYLAAVLRKSGRSIEVVNLSPAGPDEALDQIPRGADLYGFTATCIDYSICERLAVGLRERGDGPIVIGGPVATVSPEYVNTGVFDSMCRGEGEGVILDMMMDLDAGLGLLPHYAKPRHLLSLDDLPYPARDLMDVIGEKIFAGGHRYFKGQSTVISGSRGCPYSCSFCAAHTIWNGKVIYRSVESVVREMRHCIDEYGIREFRFSDDTFNLPPKRLRQLCEEFAKLDVAWRCSIRAGVLDIDDYKLMASSGCKQISVGVETWDQRVLDTLQKNITVEKSQLLCEEATEAGLGVHLLMMCGTPGERRNTPKINQRFLQSVPFASVSLTQFRPIPGSAIWADPARFGCRILDTDFDHYNFYFWRRGDEGQREETPIASVIETDLLSKAELENNMRQMRDYVIDTGKCNQG